MNVRQQWLWENQQMRHKHEKTQQLKSYKKWQIKSYVNTCTQITFIPRNLKLTTAESETLSFTQSSANSKFKTFCSTCLHVQGAKRKIQMSSGNTHYWSKVTIISLFLLPTVAATHTTITQHTYSGNTTMWQGNALKILKNQSWHSSQHLDIYSPCGRHHTCTVLWLIYTFYAPYKQHI